MRRYNIVHGDKTTAGGIVLASQNSSTNMGRAIVMIGDQVICPKCHTTGVVVAYGPRLHCYFMGREAALDRDLCVCACNPKPRLINSLNCMGQTMTVEEVVQQGYGSWVGYKEGPSTPTTGTLFDDKFVLKDGAGKPIPNAIYAVERHSGVFEYGETNGSGHTFLLAATVVAENVKFYLVG